MLGYVNKSRPLADHYSFDDIVEFSPTVLSNRSQQASTSSQARITPDPITETIARLEVDQKREQRRPKIQSLTNQRKDILQAMGTAAGRPVSLMQQMAVEYAVHGNVPLPQVMEQSLQKIRDGQILPKAYLNVLRQISTGKPHLEQALQEMEQAMKDAKKGKKR
jgi:hypothetical protein